jgi:Phosphatidylserine/phosphatidylglycerophosphate/cardiolipin synthases and related enzymes
VNLPGNSGAEIVSYFWGRATIVDDHPDKVTTSAAKIETHLAPQLRDVVGKTRRELFLVSPYFVPGKQGVDLLAGVHQRGVRVVVSPIRWRPRTG